MPSVEIGKSRRSAILKGRVESRRRHIQFGGQQDIPRWTNPTGHQGEKKKSGAPEKYLDTGLRVACRGTIAERNGLGERSSKLEFSLLLKAGVLISASVPGCLRASCKLNFTPRLLFPQHKRTSQSFPLLLSFCFKALRACLQMIPLSFT